MQCSVWMTVEVDDEAEVGQMETAIVEAGQRAMRQALGQMVEQYEVTHRACPLCGSEESQSQGTVRRCVLTRFGRVVLRLRRQRCERCDRCERRFRPAQGCLRPLAGGNVTPALGAACALAGASWPYVTAARVLRELCGAQVSHEEVRRWTVRHGMREAGAQQAEAAALLTPSAEQVRAERDAEIRTQRLGAAVPRAAVPRAAVPRAAVPRAAVPRAAVPHRLTVGLDGGWIPSRDQVGGMEGKVGVVATGAEAVGHHGRQRLTPRRYVATFGTSEQVGALAYAAAHALGGNRAHEQVVLGDGAGWIKAQARWHFPEALGILDWAHVSRALHKAIRAARPGRAHKALRRQLHQAIPDTLWHGDLDATLAALRALCPAPPAEPVPVLEETLRYLDGQRAWLGDYATWQAQGYPVGSGLIERAVAIVLNWRMKGRGMRWCRHNASAVVALRVRELNADEEADHGASPLAA